ncbi:hypothetical protein BEP19_05720 [Ammoniphilus oxalaticus]|uniref:TIGR04086 family membrane protein n=1 Tax=Ammoniphilus oxalaticus TaxID=66863 RepID=A0A419SL24_9BACL|nr:TIGR04086 family membrane protein [Ammoniphilus oxalaticus]RKD24660.1 hypothetical protein BEP19_05720 [Ammoniphilus oxalaticus]
MASSSSPIITGALTTLGLVVIGSLLTSLLLHFSQMSELTLPYFTYSINGLSLLIGGYIAGRRGGQKGWYFGGLTGVAYFILVFLIGFLAFDVAPQLSVLLFLVIAFVVGALGGVLGVNLSQSTK